MCLWPLLPSAITSDVAWVVARSVEKLAVSMCAWFTWGVRVEGARAEARASRGRGPSGRTVVCTSHVICDACGTGVKL